MTYDNTNRGAAWKNDRKQSDTHPDATGSINVEGVEYFLDVWYKKKDANEKAPLFSIKVKRKDKQPEQSATEAPPVAAPDFDDAIPF